jgi:hypothetical protein
MIAIPNLNVDNVVCESIRNRSADENIGSIVINEVLYNPIGSEVDGEWVELFNCGDEIQKWMENGSSCLIVVMKL